MLTSPKVSTSAADLKFDGTKPTGCTRIGVIGTRMGCLGQHASFASWFEMVVPPGFNVGARAHERAEEFLYLIEGTLAARVMRNLGKAG